MTGDEGLVITLDTLSSGARDVLGAIRQANRAALITDEGDFIAAILPFRNLLAGKQVLAVAAMDERRLRHEVAEGAQSPPAGPADEAYFSGLRDHAEAEARVQAVIDRHRTRLLPGLFQAWLNGLGDRQVAMLAENWDGILAGLNSRLTTIEDEER